MTNRNTPGFYQKMKDDLAACGGAIKDFLFTAGHRNGRLMDPARQLRGLAAAEIWGADPIHPRSEIYGLLAEGVIGVERTCNSGIQKRINSPGGDGGHHNAGVAASNRGGPQQSTHHGGGRMRGARGGPATSGGRHSWKRGGGGGGRGWRGHHRGSGGGRSSRWGDPY